MSTRSSISSILPPVFNLVSFTQIASLWSDYGHIYRLKLKFQPTSLILKAIHPPSLNHPSESHLRKLLSYEIERWFYHNLASRLPHTAKIANSYTTLADNDGNLLLEDLSIEYPFPARGSLGIDATECVLEWLAMFHGTFFRIHKTTELNLMPSPNTLVDADIDFKHITGVWQRGTYWYLETRQEELAEVDQEEYGWLLPWVGKVNDAIDREVKTYGTLLHGDVKGANIIFSRDPYAHRQGRHVIRTDDQAPLRCALYDLQYVGLGLPVHDLVYFFGTSVESSLLSPSSEKALLRFYHDHLLAIVLKDPSADQVVYPFETFLRHWELAIVDWYRFMTGWGFWGNDRWVERRAKEIVKKWQTDPSTWTS